MSTSINDAPYTELHLDGHDVVVYSDLGGTRLIFVFGASLIAWNSMSARVNGEELRAVPGEEAKVVRWVAPKGSKVLENGALALRPGAIQCITDMRDEVPFFGARED